MGKIKFALPRSQNVLRGRGLVHKTLASARVPLWVFVVSAGITISSRIAAEETRQSEVVALILQLAADSFSERETATRKLIEMGVACGAAVQDAARSNPNPEIRARAQNVLRRLPASHLWLNSPQFDRSSVKEKLVSKSGVIERDETWTADSTYLIDANLSVSGKAKVSIAPGTVVLVKKGATIEIGEDAAIIARADDHWNPVVFTVAAEKEDDGDAHWGKIVVRGGLAMKNVQIHRSSGILHANNPNLEMGFYGVGIYDTEGTALTFKKYRSHHGEITIRGCTAAGVAFGDGAHPTFEDVRIFDAKEGVVTVSTTSSPHFKRLQISHMQGTGLSITHGAVNADELTIDKCKVGASFTDRSSSSWYQKATISNCETGAIIDRGSNFYSLQISDIKGVGVHLRDKAYPKFVRVDLVRVNGTGVLVEGGSRPYIDVITQTDCKGKRLQVENGSEVREGAKAVLVELERRR